MGPLWLWVGWWAALGLLHASWVYALSHGWRLGPFVERAVLNWLSLAVANHSPGYVPVFLAGPRGGVWPAGNGCRPGACITQRPGLFAPLAVPAVEPFTLHQPVLIGG